MLSRRALSEGEIAVRLRGKGCPEADVAPVLARLRDLQLVDDPALCRRLVRSYREGRLYGPAKIAWKLAARRFPRELIAEAMREESPPEEVAADAVAALRRKYRGKIPPGREAAAKAYRFLAARGFPPDACRKAVGVRNAEPTEGDD